jgi:hypothetical protein
MADPLHFDEFRMSSVSESSSPLSFEAMGLRVGQNLQLLRHHPSPFKCYTTLIGYVDREFFLLRLPREAGGAVRFEQGQMVEVRLFSGLCIYSFDSGIESLLLHPRDYMLMTYPSEIREHRLRGQHRVPVKMPIDIQAVGAAGMAPAGHQIVDLSGSGALIAGPEPLGQVGERWRVTLNFELNTTGKLESVSTGVTIQNATTAPAPDQPGAVVYHHGVKFDTVDPLIALLVHEIQSKIKPLA